MDVIYGLIPAMLIIGLVMVVVLIWAARKGQYDDLEGPAHRILMDEDDPLLPQGQRQPPKSAAANPDQDEPDAK